MPYPYGHATATATAKNLNDMIQDRAKVFLLFNFYCCSQHLVVNGALATAQQQQQQLTT